MIQLYYEPNVNAINVWMKLLGKVKLILNKLIHKYILLEFKRKEIMQLGLFGQMGIRTVYIHSKDFSHKKFHKKINEFIFKYHIQYQYNTVNLKI